MTKAFITKLPSSVDNDNLPVLGQLRINWLKQNDLTDNDQRYIELSTTDSITVKVSGAHFTDSTLSSNLGNIKTIKAADYTVGLYVSNDADAILTIDNKYSLITLNFVKANKYNLKRSVYFDIDDIKYCTNLSTISLLNTQVSGDISSVSKLSSLSTLSLSNTNISGDISAVRNLTKLTDIRLENTKVNGDISAMRNLTNIKYMFLTNTNISGDISAVSKCTNIQHIFLSNTKVNGDISAVRNLTNLAYLSLNGIQVSGNISVIGNITNISGVYLNNTQVSGDIDSLANLTVIRSLFDLQGLSLTGDMSKVPAQVNLISQLNRKISTNFTWTANGRQNATLLAMTGNIPFDTVSMDNMFIDQATCTYRPDAGNLWTKIISVNGTRTSASDAAVTAIQNMGITITGVTKQA